MTKDEITKIINRKGYYVKDTFYCFYNILTELFVFDDLDDDTIATLSYNCNLTFMNIVLDNKEFFEKNYNVRGRYRERLRKDIETMHRLEYEELVSSYMEDVEQLVIEDLQQNIKNNER